MMLCKRAFSQGKGLTDEVHVLRSENEQLKTELSKACGHMLCAFVVVHASWDGRVLSFQELNGLGVIIRRLPGKHEGQVF